MHTSSFIRIASILGLVLICGEHIIGCYLYPSGLIVQCIFVEASFVVAVILAPWNLIVCHVCQEGSVPLLLLGIANKQPLLQE